MLFRRSLSVAAGYRRVNPYSKRVVYIGGSAVLGAGGYLFINSDDVRQSGVFRFGRAACAVAKIIADYKLSLRGISSPSEEYDTTLKQCHHRSAGRLLQLAKDNGGVFIKVGQHLASLEYLLPPEYTKVLSVLTSNAPRQDFADIKLVIEQELGKPISDVFSEFDETPVGAASLAQVHPARLKTGEKVAVKVQHRRVYQNSRTDLNTMELLVGIADRVFPEFSLMWLVNEVKKNLPKELDFLHEARNADAARKLFGHLSFLKVPSVYYEYSTPRLLVMEFCDGAHIDDVEFLDSANIDKHDICRKMAKLISEMVFLAGYLHSDPHPGNVLIRKRKNGKVEIVLLDHGLYLTLSDQIRVQYSNLWLALLNADQEQLKQVAVEMGIGDLYGLFACMVARRSWKSVTQGIGKSMMDVNERQELREYAVSLIPQISEVLSRMPREMLLILKTNDLLRNLEHILGTSGRGDSLIEISKSVIRSHYRDTLMKTHGFVNRLRINFTLYWMLLKIYSYEYYLIFRDSIGYSAL